MPIHRENELAFFIQVEELGHLRFLLVEGFHYLLKTLSSFQSTPKLLTPSSCSRVITPFLGTVPQSPPLRFTEVKRYA